MMLLFSVIVGHSSCGCEHGVIPDHINNAIMISMVSTVVLGIAAICFVLRDKK